MVVTHFKIDVLVSGWNVQIVISVVKIVMQRGAACNWCATAAGVKKVPAGIGWVSMGSASLRGGFKKIQWKD